MHGWVKTFIVAGLLLSGLMVASVTAASSDPFGLDNPKVIEIGKRQDIRVAYDVKDDVWDAGIGKALYYVRGLLESYQSMGVSPDKLHISVIMHGATVYWLLNDAAYQEYKQDPFDYNPNEQVVRELLSHGVSVEACYSTMKGKNWTAEDLLPGVTIVHDAYTRLIDLQQSGYAYIRF